MKYHSKHLTSVFFIVCIVSTQIQAQNMIDENIKSWQLKSYAKSAERSGDVYSAIDYYEAYMQQFPNDLKIVRNLAELYYAARDYENAAFMFLKTYHLDIDKYTQSLYYYALMEKMQGNYERAIEYFNKFVTEYKGEKDSRDFRKMAKTEIEGCELALRLYENPAKEQIIVKHLNPTINKAHVELSPAYINKNTMLYASLPANSIEYYPADDTSQWPVRQFYTAVREGDTWNGGYKFEGPFNVPGVNTANGTFSPDKKRFYFNRCQKNWLNETVCYLYVSTNLDGNWQEPVILPEPVNLSNYTSTQPTIGKSWKTNSEIIYFASNRPDGKGGMDIWYTVFDTVDFKFSEPRSLSRKINSDGDEITPFYDNEAKHLYFSSNGSASLGGFDIFKSEGEESKFGDAVNLGFPLNSSADDLYFVMYESEEEGFLVSNRYGGTSLKNETCCDDIYQFRILNFIRYTVEGILIEDEDNILQQYIAQQSFNVRQSNEEEFTPPRLKNVDVTLYVVDKNTMEEMLLNKTRTSAAGNYKFNLLPEKNYRIVINEGGVFTKEFEFNTFNRNNNEIKLDTTALIIMPDQPLEVKNIYYEFDRSALSEDAKVSLDTTLLRILNEIPEIIVEISSHTDSKGNDDYNMRLSQSRAESVVTYLIGKGIPKERLIAKGYGETRPLVSNTNPDGSDNPEGREKNRRTEFRIIGNITENVFD